MLSPEICPLHVGTGKQYVVFTCMEVKVTTIIDTFVLFIFPQVNSELPRAFNARKLGKF